MIKYNKYKITILIINKKYIKQHQFTFLNLFLANCTKSFKALCKECLKVSLLLGNSESKDN